MKILAIDLGLARTGIAVSDKDELVAYPLKVIFQHNRDKLLKEIKLILEDEKPGQVVFGLPKNMDGSEGGSAEYVKNFAKDLYEATGCDITFFDERVSTVLADTYLNSVNKKGRKKRKIIDKVAAVVILQSYIDFRKNQTLSGSSHDLK